jgi:predicted HAD superfamily Cof-like phosphohydrolase
VQFNKLTTPILLVIINNNKESSMTNPFKDIETFGTACDQPPSEDNYKMYLSLIDEEYDELLDAVVAQDRVEQLDALVDILVVTMGAIRAAGFDGEGAWKEVMDTNFAKIDPTTGKVRKREDGKVLKPEGWKAPELAQFIGG